MSKVSALPLAEPLTGDELVPLVQDGQTRKGSIGDHIGNLAAPFIAEAAAIATDASAFANFISGDLAAAEAATAPGDRFSIAGDGEIIAYLRTPGGSTELGRAVTKANLSRSEMAEGVGTASGNNLQIELNRGGRFKGPIAGAPYRSTQDRMREQIWLDEAPGADDTAKGKQALAYLADRGGGEFWLPGREIEIDETWFVPSNVNVRGQGSATHVRFAGTNPDLMGVMSHLNPRQGNVRASAFALIGQYPDDISAANYNAAHTGDYPVIAPRAFAPNTVIKPGATSLPMASLGDLADVAPGDFLRLERGFMGWHTALHEMVRVRAIDGTTVHLAWPVLYEYRNAANDPFNLFMRPIAYNGGRAAPGVDQAAFEGWRQCGWRRVDPVINARLENMRISNEVVHEGYANLAVMICRGLNCSFDNIELTGGGLWNLHCEGTRGTLVAERSNPAFPQTDVLPGNGSNRTYIIADMRTGSLAIEEGCLNGKFEGRSNTNIQVQQFCREISVDMVANSGSLYGILVDKSAPTRIRGRYTSPQPALWVATRDLFHYYPQATLAMFDSLVGDYFNGMLIEAQCELVESTANNSLDVYLGQPIRGTVNVGGQFGGVYSIPDAGAGVIVGKATRLFDRSDQTSPSVQGRPAARFPFDRDLAYPDGANDKIWRWVNGNRKTIAAVANASNFTVNANTTQGGVRTGDVAMVLIQNTAPVDVNTLRYVGYLPNFGPVTYAPGGARRWHISDVAGINPATGEVNITTPVPDNWQAVAGDDSVSCAFFGRWG
ncbi:hypothetical protein GCM10009424_30700 [Sphingomonas ursincola]|uniref:Uncharacterized protein n=1 Tax=Sphingomonas ursincola TaxID=56361 RepID=A0A7V8RBM0_9SPHN|nr:hypothetical protein [Sphingomonas ursincola]MBA1373200.1 hypothetical protein [Sphingomonas ursincola]